MEIKLFDSELKVMNVLWREGDKTAKELSNILNADIGWNQNTTYTVIKKCIAKGAIARSEPHFLCHALISKEEVQAAEAEELIGKLFDGSANQLFAALLGQQKLSGEELAQLHRLIDQLEKEDKDEPD
ncbi:MAG: BlaI/MecI/CopY family transcriptional regulator [Clostridiales bacterium]|nr:BlaI/MecI/CopY family transcriptional regulator [Clostridiales bacterium]